MEPHRGIFPDTAPYSLLSVQRLAHLFREVVQALVMLFFCDRAVFPYGVQHLPLLEEELVVFLFEGQTIPSVIVMREIHRVTRRPKSSLRLSRHNGADYTTTKEKKQLARAGK